jgi:serine phosphatase RsbU (regulator of sigma subunit)
MQIGASPVFSSNEFSAKWEEEVKRLAAKSVVTICLMAASVNPFFAFFEYSCCPERFSYFLVLHLAFSSFMLLCAWLQKKLPLPSQSLSYIVAVAVGVCFAYMAATTGIQNVHNYLNAVSMITLVGGVLYFGRVLLLAFICFSNVVIAFLFLYFMRPEPLGEIPDLWNSFFFCIIIAMFSIAGMNLRYQLTQKNFINALKVKKSLAVIEEKNKDILDSITYARRIQQAILIPEAEIKNHFSDVFILFKPKDIVSGDFYWFAESGENKVLAVADCTGHGVPGGFMSMLGFEILNQTLLQDEVKTTAEALKALDEKITETLNRNDRSYRDGMDMVLCAFSRSSGRLQFSCANRPLIMVRKGEVKDFSSDKYPIGGGIDNVDKKFRNQEMETEKGDMIYLFTDGYADQFGGPKGKKFMYRQLLKTFQDLHDKPLDEQRKMFEEIFTKWKGGLEQVDDVLLIGIKI